MSEPPLDETQKPATPPAGPASVRPPSVSSSLRARLADLHIQADERSLEDTGPIPGGALEDPAGALRYLVRGEIGRGGMGAILKVWDSDLRRNIAMKVAIGRGGLGPGAAGAAGAADAAGERKLARFLEEAQVTGQLDHPGVVPVHELGVEADGRLYFTMRLVRGRDFLKIIALARAREEGWSLTRALASLLRVCETMAYAHSKGVVHRDLKPANVMIGQFGETYVMDWGLAKVLGKRDALGEELEQRLQSVRLTTIRTDRSESTRTPGETQEGAVMGTPDYMPPEQASGRLEEIGPHSDVYSVGCMLYQLLTGRRPFERPGERIEVATLLMMVMKSRPEPVSELSPEIPAELAAICEKAMAFDWKERYPSVLEMAEDLRAYLEGRVVQAYETGPFAEFKKWVLRHKGLAAALLGLVLVAALSAGGFIWMQRQSVLEIRSEQAQTELARNEALQNLAVAQANEARALRQSYATNIIAADVSLRAGEIREAKRHLADCAPELRGWEWRHLFRSSDTSALAMQGHTGPVACLALAADGGRVLSGSEDGTARLWDVASGETLLELRDVHESGVVAVAFDASGGLVTLGGWTQPNLRSWDPATGELTSSLDLPDVAAHSVALSPDGALLAFGTAEGTIELLDLRSGHTVGSLAGHALAVSAVAFGPAGARVASGSEDGSLSVWDTRSGSPLWTVEVNAGPILAVAFGPAGERVAAGVADGAVRLHSAADGRLERVLIGHGKDVDALAFDPRGERLASGSLDKTVRVWELEGDAEPSVLRGHDEPLRSLVFSPDGKRVLSAAEDGSLRVWEPGRIGAVTRWNAEDWVSSVAMHDTEHIAAGTRMTGRVVLLRETGEVVATLPGPEMPVGAVRFSPDGTRLAWATEERSEVLVWDVDARERTAVLSGHSATVTSVAFGPDGERIVSGAQDHTVRLWETRSGHALTVFEQHGTTVQSVDYAPDGSAVVSADAAGRVLVWDPRTLAVSLELESGDQAVLAVRFSPDGRWIATAGAEASIRLFDARSGALQSTLVAHENAVSSLSFSPDGSRLVSGSFDKTLRIWATDGGRQLLSLRGHTQPVADVAFSPDGEHIVSGAFDESVLIWHADTRASER